MESEVTFRLESLVVYRAKAAHSGKCAEVKDWSKADRGDVIQMNCAGVLKMSQRWYLVGPY